MYSHLKRSFLVNLRVLQFLARLKNILNIFKRKFLRNFLKQWSVMSPELTSFSIVLFTYHQSFVVLPLLSQSQHVFSRCSVLLCNYQEGISGDLLFFFLHPHSVVGSGICITCLYILNVFSVLHS